MRLEAFLTDLLYEHDCVIIPGIGGLVANYRPARLNRLSNTIKPPSKHVGFNRHLTHNDGLLAHHVARILGISYNEALARIEETVATYHEQMAQDSRVVWEHIGLFFRDRNGHIQFIPDEQENFLLNSFGLQIIQLLPVAQKETEGLVTPVLERTLRPVWWKVAAAIAIPILIAGGVVVGNQIGGNSHFDLASIIPFHAKEQNASYTPREKKADFSYKSESIDRGIVAARDENPKADKIYYDFITGSTSENGIEVVVRHPAPSPENSKEKIKEKNIFPSSPHSTSGIFGVIAGAFVIEENADKYIAELNQKGISANRLGKYKGLHLVALGTFQTKSEAAEACDRARNLSGIKTWILHR